MHSLEYSRNTDKRLLVMVMVTVVCFGILWLVLVRATSVSTTPTTLSDDIHGVVYIVEKDVESNESKLFMLSQSSTDYEFLRRGLAFAFSDTANDAYVVLENGTKFDIVKWDVGTYIQQRENKEAVIFTTDKKPSAIAVSKGATYMAVSYGQHVQLINLKLPDRPSVSFEGYLPKWAESDTLFFFEGQTLYRLDFKTETVNKVPVVSAMSEIEDFAVSLDGKSIIVSTYDKKTRFYKKSFFWWKHIYTFDAHLSSMAFRTPGEFIIGTHRDTSDDVLSVYLIGDTISSLEYLRHFNDANRVREVVSWHLLSGSIHGEHHH